MSAKLLSVLQSSIVKKQAMAITGLLLCGFLVVHLAGNILLLVSAEAFNTYAHTLTKNKAILYAAEVVLGLIFASHIGMAMKLTFENLNARPERYYFKKVSGRGSTFASSTMPITGALILIFLILHIQGIKFGADYTVVYSGVEMRDLHRLCVEYFSNGGMVVYYVFTMIALGIHLSHGVWSAFQSLGFNNPTYDGPLRFLSSAFGLIMCIGFSALPIVLYLKGGA